MRKKKISWCKSIIPCIIGVAASWDPNCHGSAASQGATIVRSHSRTIMWFGAFFDSSALQPIERLARGAWLFPTKVWWENRMNALHSFRYSTVDWTPTQSRLKKWPGGKTWAHSRDTAFSPYLAPCRVTQLWGGPRARLTTATSRRYSFYGHLRWRGKVEWNSRSELGRFYKFIGNFLEEEGTDISVFERYFDVNKFLNWRIYRKTPYLPQKKFY